MILHLKVMVLPFLDTVTFLTSANTVSMEASEAVAMLNPVDSSLLSRISLAAHSHSTSSSLLTSFSILVCMMLLSSKLYQMEQERIEAAYSGERRSQVGSGMRNEKIRTYNFPQSRVTDHRIGLTLYKIDNIMNGDLDEIVDALIAADQAEKLRESGESL